MEFQNISEDQLSSLLNQLCLSLNPTIPRNYTLPQNFQHLLQRILSTNFSVLRQDESAIVNDLLEQVSKIPNISQNNLNKFQFLYAKLTKKRNLSKRWGILYLLNSIYKKSQKKNNNFYGTRNLQNNLLSSTSNSKNNTFNKQLTQLNNNNYLVPFSNLRDNFYNNNDNNQLISQNYNNNLINDQELNSPIIVNQFKTSLQISEKDIISDLLFIFEGINGKYIAYDASVDSYILNKMIPWSEEIYDIVSSLCEIGWLYRKIKLYLDYYKESNFQSQFIQSFIYSVQNELNNYFKLISFFKKINTEKKEDNNPIQTLNLKNLVLWTLGPKKKLKWIAIACESLYSLKGTAVLSQIFSLVSFGGGDCLINILNDVSRPFINFIMNWIKYGELQDPYKEFFVEILQGIKDDDIWNLQYQLIGKNVPNFMKRDPTIKIFEIGKCLHFIRNYCKENYNLLNLKNILINIINKYSDFKNKNNMDLEEEKSNDDNKSISNMNIDDNNNYLNDFDYGIDKEKIIFEIESYQYCLDFINYIFDPVNQEKILEISFLDEIFYNIDVIHKLLNKDLIRIIFNKFKFLKNLESINKYLLLGQGDMMQTLMDSLYEELKKPANLIFKHNLQVNLESAVRASNANFNDEECVKKLFIKLINPSVGDLGWDIFCLEYKVDLPLNIIFNSKLLKDYQKLFFFFWKLKRLDYSQNYQVWRDFMAQSHSIKNNYDTIKNAMKISIKFNQEIIHFLSNLHNFLSLEVLENQYKNLITEIAKVSDLNELIKKHKNFVSNIKKQCLLDEENVTINKKIIAIFDIILRFKSAHDILSTSLLEKHYENLNEENIISKKVDYTKESIKQIYSLYKEFQNQIIELIHTIEILGKNNLRFLSMKLDFNYFYSFLEKEEEDKKNIMAINRINAQKERNKILNQKEQIEDSGEKSLNENNIDDLSDNINNSNDNNNNDNNMSDGSNNNYNFYRRYNNSNNEDNFNLNDSENNNFNDSGNNNFNSNVSGSNNFNEDNQ